MSDERDQREKSADAPASPLIGRERIRGATRVIPEGTPPPTVTAEQIAAVASDALLFIQSHKIGRKLIAKALNYSESTLSEFLNGKYKGDNGQLAIDLESWLIQEESRRSRPQTTSFTWTNVAMLIKATAFYCLDYKTIGIVYGPDTTGIGKTTSMQAIHQLLGPRGYSAHFWHFW